MAKEDKLDYSGLQTKDYNTLLDELQTNLSNIYSPSGEEINFDSSSPDGQITNILTEMGVVIRDIETETYNSCSPSNCSGAVQDIRYQINYLFRKGGTYTIQPIKITSDRTVTLQGLDAQYNDVNASSYTVSDDTGNLWFLIDTTTIYAGETTLAFRAKNIGQVIPVIGTITNQNTIVAGITKVINDVGYTSLGEEQETDEEFRLRRERSVSQASQNNVDTIIGRLLQLDGVTDVNTWINNTNTTDETGTNGHTLWTIINGGANSDIADIIYSEIGGAETRGNIEVIRYSQSKQPLTIRFDRPTPVPLYERFNIRTTGDVNDLNLNGIKETLINQVSFKIGSDVSTSNIANGVIYSVQTNGGGNNSYATDIEIANNAPSATVEVTSTTITSASVDAKVFATKFQDSNSYIFDYVGTEWQYEQQAVNLTDYGITFEGTPSSGDDLVVNYTASTWTSFIKASTKADLFTLDASRIYPTVIKVA